MNEWNEFWQLFSLIFLATAIPVAFIIVLEKRSPFKTIAWILVLILLPIAGVIFYLFFGQEYRKRKLFSRKGIKSLGKFRQLATKQLQTMNQNPPNSRREIIEKGNLVKLLLNNSNALLTLGNQIEILKNGEDTFRAIINTIQNARHHIHLEYYIIADDKIGNKIKDLLIKKRKEGVEVRIIIDDVGSWSLSKEFIAELKANNIEIYSFMEVRFPRLTSRVNYRNHRKILIVDGEIGITGGTNISDLYIEGLIQTGKWHDTNILLTGDAVACLQVVFAADWHSVINENLIGINYFKPFSERKEGTPIQISTSGPDSDWPSISQAFLVAITNARKRVYLVSPYFMPPQSLVLALKTTALSNIDVQIVMPEKSDVIIPKWSAFSYVEELLEAGVIIHFYQNGFIHSKYMIVDDVFCTVGTTNFDFRSLETNFEVNTFIYDEQVVSSLKNQFIAETKDSREIKLREWENRPWHFKLRESLARIIAPMM